MYKDENVFCFFCSVDSQYASQGKLGAAILGSAASQDVSISAVRNAVNNFDMARAFTKFHIALPLMY